jgi:hypothetical protein
MLVVGSSHLGDIRRITIHRIETMPDGDAVAHRVLWTASWRVIVEASGL